MYAKVQIKDKYVSLELSKPPRIQGLLAAQIQWGREPSKKFHHVGLEVRSGTALEVNPPHFDERLIRELNKLDKIAAAEFDRRNSMKADARQCRISSRRRKS